MSGLSEGSEIGRSGDECPRHLPAAIVPTRNGLKGSWVAAMLAVVVTGGGGVATFAHECAAVASCGPVVSYGGGSFGNVGFATAASVCSSRTIWTGFHCGRPVSVCPPRWCGPCLPGAGWSFGWPDCRIGGWPHYGVGGWPHCGIGSWPHYGVGGWPHCGIGSWPRSGIGGWYGTSSGFGTQTIIIGGPGTVVSGWAVPWWWGARAGAPMPALATFHQRPVSLGFSPPAGQRAALVGRPLGLRGRSAPLPTAQPASDATRRRAADQVAAGDRHLRGAGGREPVLRAALACYRRAAAADADCPETFIRQALVHAALADRAGCEAAIAKAVALDGRLSAAPVATPADPVFGGTAGQSALALRGDGLIAEIAAAAGQGGAAAESADLQWLSASWATRGAAPLGRLAAARP